MQSKNNKNYFIFFLSLDFDSVLVPTAFFLRFAVIVVTNWNFPVAINKVILNLEFPRQKSANA